MKTKYKQIEWSGLLSVALLAFALLLIITGCAPQKHVYKVVFENGDYEYYELNYKPRPDSRAIEYDGETIIGVKNIERVE